MVQSVCFNGQFSFVHLNICSRQSKQKKFSQDKKNPLKSLVFYTGNLLKPLKLHLKIRSGGHF